MSFKTEQRITAWSPSRLGDYLQCPRRAKYKILDKLPEPPSVHLERGTQIHEQLEHYVAGRTSIFPDVNANIVTQVKMLVDEYKAKKVWVEIQLAFNSKWKMVDWYSREAWLRLKIDVRYNPDTETVEIIDWKTGKVKPFDTYRDQVELYELASLVAGWGSEAKGYLIFTDPGIVMCDTDKDDKPTPPMKMDVVEAKKAVWERKVLPMLNDREFAPVPGRYCSWCPFSRNKGGPCDF